MTTRPAARWPRASTPTTSPAIAPRAAAATSATSTPGTPAAAAPWHGACTSTWPSAAAGPRRRGSATRCARLPSGRRPTRWWPGCSSKAPREHPGPAGHARRGPPHAVAGRPVPDLRHERGDRALRRVLPDPDLPACGRRQGLRHRRPDAVGRAAGLDPAAGGHRRSEEHTSELQSHLNLVCRLLLEKKKGASSGRAPPYTTTLRGTRN